MLDQRDRNTQTSTDAAMITGRELYGMPKLICDDDVIRMSGNKLAGYPMRNANLTMELSMAINGGARLTACSSDRILHSCATFRVLARSGPT